MDKVKLFLGGDLSYLSPNFHWTTAAPAGEFSGNQLTSWGPVEELRVLGFGGTTPPWGSVMT